MKAKKNHHKLLTNQEFNIEMNKLFIDKPIDDAIDDDSKQKDKQIEFWWWDDWNCE